MYYTVILMNIIVITATSFHDVTPHMRRIRFTGIGLVKLAEPLVPGMHVKILLPREGQVVPTLPGIENGRPVYQPNAVKPYVRTYTVRAYNAQTHELDIDFVLHGDEGPASTWAERVKPGDRIGIAIRNIKSLPQTDWYLFAGDQTALPAISTYLEQLSETAKGFAFIEVSDQHEEQTLNHPQGIVVKWLHRREIPAGKANLLFDAVKSLTIPKENRYIWTATESHETKTIRAWLMDNHQLRPEELYATGYWRLGVNEDVYHDMRHRGE